MEYREAVAEVRRRLKRSEEDQWFCADQTYEQVKAGVSRRQWAEDIDVSHSHVNTLYRLGEKFSGQHLSTRPRFAEAYRAVHTPGRVAEEERLGSQTAAEATQAVRNMPPEQKAAVVREALDDPDVATRVMRDPHTSARMSHAREEVYKEKVDTAKMREQDSPAQREAANTAEHFEVGNHLRLSRFHAAEAARRLQDIEHRDPDMVRSFQGDAQEVRDALDWFEVVVRGGKVDDDALAKFLEGGA